MTDQIIRFFQYSWVLIGLSGLFPIYLNRSGIKSKQQITKAILAGITFIIFGLVVQNNFNAGFDLTKSEATILLGLAALVYITRLLPIIFVNCIVRYEQVIPLRKEMKLKLVKTTFEKIKSKLKSETNEQLFVTTKGNYGMEFLMTTSFSDGIKSAVVFESHPSGSSLGRFRFLFLLSSYTSIMALVEGNLKIPIPLFSSKIDAELFFALFIFLLYAFLFLQNSVQHNFFFEFEQMQKYILPELAKNTYKLEKEEGGEGGMEIDLKSDLQSAKERALKIKDSKAKQALDEKRQKVKERISNIIGTSDEEEAIDPELIKKQILIRRVKTLLKSTPVGYNADLKAITEKVESKNEKEIEPIIVGLIDRKEVQGSYDMWSQIYTNGDVNSQFIDRTLNKLELDPSELEFIKVSRSGDVEIRFKNDKGNGISQNEVKNIPSKSSKKSDIA